MTDPMTDEEAHLVCSLMRRFLRNQMSCWRLEPSGFLDGYFEDASQKELQAMEKLYRG